MKTIIIDPGHGGNDSGAVFQTKTNLIKESDINLWIANLLFKKLIYRTNGFLYLMTRTSNIDKSLGLRAGLANLSKAIFFISIHQDSSINQQAEGMTIYKHIHASPKTNFFSEKLKSEILIKQPYTPFRGIKNADFMVLRETKMPAFLIECGFLSNEKYQRFLLNDNSFEVITDFWADCLIPVINTL